MDPNVIAKLAQIASVLEVSGYPKPGNVHRNRDFHDMVFEDFLISGISIGDVIRDAASSVSCEDLSDAHLGKYIYDAVSETNKWVETNTNLGIVMMITPIACAAAISSSFDELQDNVGALMDATTVDDAINLYDAINIAEAGGMGSQDEYDVTSENAKEELRKNNQTMFDVLEISSKWDRLASELTNKMPVSFEIAYPTYYDLRKTKSLNDACVLTFLKILSEVPDTLIDRKYGIEKAEEVSKLSKELLSHVDDEDFHIKLQEFDDYLFENKLNPGTTADLVVVGIFLSYLKLEFDKS